MQSFLRGIEIWIPSSDGGSLLFADGIYGGVDDFSERNRAVALPRGEGLPGLAWSMGEPRVMRLPDYARFRRADLAGELELTCGVALPQFAGEVLKSVVVLLFSREQEAQAGAVEIWRCGGNNQLVLSDGYYGALTGFAESSRRVAFAPGEGLPGSVWERRLPMVLGDLGNEQGFFRAAEAAAAGLRVGLGMPCQGPDERLFVVTLLSASRMPIAHRFEIWTPRGDRSGLVFGDGETMDGPMYGETYTRVSIAPGDGAKGIAWQSGLPVIRRKIVSEPVLASGRPASRQVSSLLALPLFDRGDVSAVVTIYI